MHLKALLAIVALVAFDTAISSATPLIPPYIPPRVTSTQTTTTTATAAAAVPSNVIDCIGRNMPESCDIFCFATLCQGLPDTLHRTKKKKLRDAHRDDCGANFQPFNDAGLVKYNTWRRADDFTQADEYPLASSLEGGNGNGGTGRAIVQGAQSGEQSRQGGWVGYMWGDTPEGGAVTISVINWDPKLSQYCDAWKANDKSVCTGSPFYGGNSPYFRLNDDGTSFRRLGV